MEDRLERLKSNKLWRDANKEFFYTVDKKDYEWLLEQAEKVERYEEALNKIATRKMSTYLSTSHMNQDFIKTAIEALNS